MAKVDLAKLDAFLRSSRLVYGTKNDRLVPEPLNFADAGFTVHEEVFGEIPIHYRKTVYFHDDPVWYLSCFGEIRNGFNPLSIYRFNRLVLLHCTGPKFPPIRGPEKYVFEVWQHFMDLHVLQATLPRFVGVQRIVCEGHLAYIGEIHGGLY